MLAHLSRSNFNFQVKISEIDECVGLNASVYVNFFPNKISCTIVRQVRVVNRLLFHFVGKLL